MCLSPVKIFNNAHYVSSVHCKPFEFNVPCGHCSECRSLKKSEWRLRAYYEAKRVFNLRGFVLFDTLTYDDDHVCWFHDYDPRIAYTCFDGFCFNRYDVTTFFKRLRVNLDRAGYAVDGNLRYFLSSEYGGDDYYYDDAGVLRRGTERPHYHVLFFVTFKIDPLVFSDFVADAWHAGRTDGRRYKGDFYVLENRYFPSESAYSGAIVNYVAKYVTKDAEYDSKVRSVVYNIMCALYPEYWNQSFVLRKKYRDLLRVSSSFHVESKGFGLYALELNSVDDIVKSNSLPMMVSRKNVVVSIPLPSYYKRKLFQRVVWFNGSRMWIWNDLGFRYARQLFVKTLDNSLKRIDKFFYRCFGSPEIDVQKLKFYCDSVLAGRSWSDYVEYVVCVKGRIKSDGFLLASPLDNALDSVSSSSFDYGNLKDFGLMYYPCNTSYDAFNFGQRVVCFNAYPNYKDFPNGFHEIPFDMVPSSYFLSAYCYSSDSFDEYKGFDLIFGLFDFIQKYLDQKVDHSSKEFEKLMKQYKDLGFFNRVI